MMCYLKYKIGLTHFCFPGPGKNQSIEQSASETSRLSVCADLSRRLRSVFTVSCHRSISYAT